MNGEVLIIFKLYFLLYYYNLITLLKRFFKFEKLGRIVHKRRVVPNQTLAGL